MLLRFLFCFLEGMVKGKKRPIALHKMNGMRRNDDAMENKCPYPKHYKKDGFVVLLKSWRQLITYRNNPIE